MLSARAGELGSKEGKMRFYKMQGLGNDFVVLVGVTPSPAQLRFLADRHYGVGADQILCLFLPDKGQPAQARFFNANGEEAEMCGNGLRCLGLLLKRRTGKARHEIRTSTRTVLVETLDPPMVQASMGAVRVLPMPKHPYIQQESLQRQVIAQALLHIGNPHLLFLTQTPEVGALAETFGPGLEKTLPDGVNVGFAHYQQAEKATLTLSVWERGAGLTQACGSAAVAVTALAHKALKCPLPVVVAQKGGDLIVDKHRSSYIQTGPAHLSFTGNVSLPS
ncbi:MAG: diaminopimelate epimerase [Holosporales bacterium]|jgi:diaminopimelate epimerase|nr:diaminopimelate epimerase [Holosporales bacterium]